MTLALVLLAVTAWLRLHCTLAADRLCQTSRIQLLINNDKCIQLLEEMNPMTRYFPASCLTNRGHFYPDRLYENNTSDSLVSVAIETVQAVSEGFRGNASTAPSSWRRDKVGLFKNILHKVERSLSPCVTTAVKMNPGLKVYSDQLNSFLTQQGHSVCAWETVRAEAHRVLEQMKRLLKNTARN